MSYSSISIGNDLRTCPVRADVTHFDIAGRMRSLLGYAIGLALYTFIVVAIYPAFKNSTSLDTLVHNDATAAALLGVSGKLTSSGGWLNANIYANFYPLITLLLTVGYGAASLAGQDEDGTLGLIVTLPVRRTHVVLQKVLAMALQAAAIAVVVTLFALAGGWFDMSVAVGKLVAISAAVLLMGLDFGLVAMAVGAVRGRRGVAIGAVAALAAASYLISSLASVASWIRPLRYASLFYWSVGNSQITAGVSLIDFAVLILTGATACVLVVIAFRRLDVR
jgi:beta-exotoxin I transport system permease protein